MRKAQQTLIDLIKKFGEVNGEIVKVDRLLNHMVDIDLIKEIGEDIAEKFADVSVDKILTVEASGIPGAQAAAFSMHKDYIFAKKKNPITMKGFFSAESFSFTKNEHTTLYVSKEVLKKGDRILFVDDFYAKGNTLKAIKKIIEQAEAELVGVAVIVDKNDTPDIHSILTLSQLKSAMGK
ncbi:phosphoribosyltransferase [Denitrovibrio acetiphilus DSM 12809]|uniref:Phosphoribosyltransferase n=1 Tax=Denitrovibrio acetiphilus (strain DSM 12809 / NBRC 114555 / N2460) TaxID=522772 RepID=D4H2C2_DENA2|nr:phosphoribosyltransferase family protein [Denitrovibrio acetiphilus]ADD68913.1 phosphoribosyltransferase [Denitrovibrio acetiphilus DSM 12809]